MSAIGKAITGAVQGAVSAVTDVVKSGVDLLQQGPQALSCLMKGDVSGAMGHVMSGIGDAVNVGMFIAAPEVAIGEGAVMGGVSGGAEGLSQDLGMNPGSGSALTGMASGGMDLLSMLKGMPKVPVL